VAPATQSPAAAGGLERLAKLLGGEVEDGPGRVAAAVRPVDQRHRDRGAEAHLPAEVPQAHGQVVDVELEADARRVSRIDAHLRAGPADGPAPLDLPLLDQAALGEVRDQRGHRRLRQARLLGERCAGAPAMGVQMPQQQAQVRRAHRAVADRGGPAAR
jgi:hypothetical protein